MGQQYTSLWNGWYIAMRKKKWEIKHKKPISIYQFWLILSFFVGLILNILVENLVI